MAKIRRKDEKEGAVIVAEEPGPEQIGPEQPDDEPKAPSPEAEPPIPERGTKFRTFFQNVERIDAADWGTRAWVTVYRLEPIIDKDRSSEPKWVEKYGEALDMARLKKDQGSGRYRLYLTFKVPAAKLSKEVDVVDVDILDLKSPPNIALGDWVDVPKNKKWAWAKAILEKREAEQAKQSQSQQDQTGEAALGVMSKAFELVGQIQRQSQPVKEPTPPPNSITEVFAAADKVLNRIMPTSPANSDELTSMREELRYQRERSDKLMDKLLDMSAKKSDGGNGLSAVKEIVSTLKDLLPDVREVIAPALEGATGGRTKMSGDQEFWQGLITGGLDKLAPSLNNFIGFLLMRAQQAAAAKAATPGAPAAQPGQTPRPGASQVLPPLPNATGQPTAPATEQPQAEQPSEPEQPNQMAMLKVLNDSLLNALGQNPPRDGHDYADSFVMMFGPLAYNQVSAMGKEAIIGMIQTLPAWQQLGPLQNRVPNFIDEFLEYGSDSEADEEDDQEDEPSKGDTEK
jgi:hypothetical protein